MKIRKLWKESHFLSAHGLAGAMHKIRLDTRWKLQPMAEMTCYGQHKVDLMIELTKSVRQQHEGGSPGRGTSGAQKVCLAHGS